MEIPQNVASSMPTSRARRIAPYLAPALLVLIAVYQITWAGFNTLSAWKGGGFGMFSTVESPGSRIVKVLIGTHDARIPIEVPKKFSKRLQRIRTQPSQQGVDELAKALSSARWAPVSLVSPDMQYQSNTGGGDLDNSAKVAMIQELNQAIAQLGMLRMLDDEEEGVAALELEYVEVICFQMEFDGSRNQVFLKPLFKGRANSHGEANAN